MLELDRWLKMSTSSYGPWATSMSTGNRLELNTFWKRRMHMLPQVARLQSRISPHGRRCLILWSLALFGLPTWLTTAQSQEIKPGTKPAAPVVAPSEPTTTEFFPELSRKEQKIIRELETTTTWDFTDESLIGIVETVVKRHGFDIVIDKVRLEENSVAVDATDINVKVSEIPLRSALRLMLRSRNLGYVIEDDVLTITTAAACEGDRVTRTYPVHDLVDAAPGDFPSLMEAIRQGVTPGAWRDSQLPAPAAAVSTAPNAIKPLEPALNTISMVPASGSLVIRQSWRGHAEVLTLLRALRRAKALSADK
ncbi:MAG: hypothetical protein JWN70_5414 [Planctomycetaceae bacterium]|nr:hypothetical protein [Planctomycetaceae bacterium]